MDANGEAVQMHTRMGQIQQVVLAKALRWAKTCAHDNEAVERGMRSFAIVVERASFRQVVGLWKEICALEDQHVAILRAEDDAHTCLRLLKERFPRTMFGVPEILDGRSVHESQALPCDDGGDLVDELDGLQGAGIVDQNDPLYVDGNGEYAGTLDYIGNGD